MAEMPDWMKRAKEEREMREAREVIVQLWIGSWLKPRLKATVPRFGKG